MAPEAEAGQEVVVVMNMNQRYHARRLALIEVLGGVCVWCGESDPDNLQVDHKEPNGAHRSSVWMLSDDDLLRELPLIQLLCVVCHPQKTKEEQLAKLDRS